MMQHPAEFHCRSFALDLSFVFLIIISLRVIIFLIIGDRRGTVVDEDKKVNNYAGSRCHSGRPVRNDFAAAT
jgi:hypothetical protein